MRDEIVKTEQVINEAASFMGRLPLVISLVIFICTCYTSLLIWLHFKDKKRVQDDRIAERKRYDDTMERWQKLTETLVERMMDNTQISVETETTLINEIRGMRADINKLLNQVK